MIEAIQAVGAQAAGGASKLGEAAMQVQSSGAADVTGGGAMHPVADVFRQTIETLRSQDVSSKAGTSFADPVADQKSQVLSTDEGKSVIADTDPAGGGLKTNSTGALGALQGSFDHAIFVSLVSQVVGGVSQATSTLVKQS